MDSTSARTEVRKMTHFASNIAATASLSTPPFKSPSQWNIVQISMCELRGHLHVENVWNSANNLRILTSSPKESNFLVHRKQHPGLRTSDCEIRGNEEVMPENHVEQHGQIREENVRSSSKTLRRISFSIFDASSAALSNDCNKVVVVVALPSESSSMFTPSSVIR